MKLIKSDNRYYVTNEHNEIACIESFVPREHIGSVQGFSSLSDLFSRFAIAKSIEWTSLTYVIGEEVANLSDFNFTLFKENYPELFI